MDTAMCYKHAQLCVGIEIVMQVVYQRLLHLHRRQKACLEQPSRPWSGHELAYLHRMMHCIASKAATYLDSHAAHCRPRQQAAQQYHRKVACCNHARHGAYHMVYRPASRLAAQYVHETVHRHRMGRCTMTTPPRNPFCSRLGLAQPNACEQLVAPLVPALLLPPRDRCASLAPPLCAQGACVSSLARRC